MQGCCRGSGECGLCKDLSPVTPDKVLPTTSRDWVGWYKLIGIIVSQMKKKYPFATLTHLLQRTTLDVLTDGYGSS